MKYDFSGWATKNNLKCSDGLTIKKNAFRVNDGSKVPLVYNHNHDNPSAILGHAMLKNKDEGVYAYCSFNNTGAGKDAKEAVRHGDIVSLSICANNVQKEGNAVVHGVIREVSLVLAGANPGAFVESVMYHGMPLDETDDEGIFYTGEGIELYHADNGEDESEDDQDGETVQDVLDTLTDKQKAAVGIVMGELLAEENDDDEGEKGEKGEMKHHIFEGKDNDEGNGFLTQSEIKQIFDDAKKCGSFRDAVKQHMKDGVLQHAQIPTTGFDVPTTTPAPTYGINGIEMLFPDYKSLDQTPQFISRNMDWVDVVINGVHRTPFARVKSIFANITEDEARAKGYIKGKRKKEEVFSVLKRVTDPKTVYKLQKVDRDDILDIGDNLNVVQWIRAEMLMMLKEEIARAILMGDGRLPSAEDKISEQHIRPITGEEDLLAVKIPVKVSANATEDDIARAIVRTMIKSRKEYKGKGNPMWFTNEDYVTDALLLEDAIGNRQYKTETELATAVRVSRIVTVEPMDGAKITVSGTQYPLIGVVVNLDDYNVGTNKNGEITWFDDFDIHYNQYEYLAETRMSGALVKPFCALVFYLDQSGTGSGSGTGSEETES